MKTTKRAFVTYLCTDDYLEGALTLGCSLRRSGTIADIVCMVTPNVNDIAKKRLKQ